MTNLEHLEAMKKIIISFFEENGGLRGACMRAAFTNGDKGREIVWYASGNERERAEYLRDRGTELNDAIVEYLEKHDLPAVEVESVLLKKDVYEMHIFFSPESIRIV